MRRFCILAILLVEFHHAFMIQRIQTTRSLGRAPSRNLKTVRATPSSSTNGDGSDTISVFGIQQQVIVVPDSIPKDKQYGGPEVLAILVVYFVQGSLGLSRLALTFFLKDEFHLGPTEIAALTGLSTIPWVIKPVYGFLSDTIPIFGYKRRSYLILSGLVGCLSWLCLAGSHSVNAAIAANIIGSASIAVSDVVADSIVVEKSRTDTASSGESTGGDLQSLCWGAAAVGGLVSAYFSGSLLEIVSPNVIFQVTALFPLLICAAALFISERKETLRLSAADLRNSFMSQFMSLKQTISNPKIYLPILFIFAWQATPSADSALFFFQINELGFKPEFLGSVRLAASIASLVGVVIFRSFLKDLKTKDVIFWTTLISVPLAMTQLLLTTHANRAIGIPDQLFALTDTVVLTVLGQIAFMPTLVLAASLCPPGVEGTLFATLMSIYNGAGTLSSELGAGLTYLLGVTDKDYSNLSLLVAICSLTSLLPLPFINLLNNSAEDKIE